MKSMAIGMPKAGFLVLVLSAWCGGVQGQALPLKLDVDHAAFTYEREQSLVELYLGIEASSLAFAAADPSGFVATLPLEIAIVRSATADFDEASVEPVWADSTVLRFMLADTSGLQPGQQFIHRIQTVVPPGEYELRLLAPSTSSRPASELRRDLRVGRYASDGVPRLSDIALATEITPTGDRNDPFYRNGLVVRPSANRLFGLGIPRVYYYVEAYGAHAIQGSADTYALYAYVADANRLQPVSGLETRRVREVRSPDVIVGSFDASNLPTGSYVLHVALLNEGNEGVVNQSRKFFIYNPDVEQAGPAALELDFETSLYAEMTEEEVEQGLEHARIIANRGEQGRMRQLSELDAKRRFLMDFWQKRDDLPSTPVNEFREAFYQRFQYANDRYATGSEEGWRSDRGRVVIEYGLPSNIESHLYDRETIPYELWSYDNVVGEGRALFVFADRLGFGRFELLHSSVSGERSMPNWQSMLSGR